MLLICEISYYPPKLNTPYTIMDIIPVTINDVKKPNIIHKTMNKITIIISIPDIFYM